MQNKSFFYNLRLTVPEHFHRKRYMEHVRQPYLSTYTLAIMAAILFATAIGEMFV